ncbi:integumentary mucin C.1-like [Corticium candelabrum]|uniref:integumentary mucin C.1-like n=1 Tax=Corticium candelabrum TaxID=121492 RepID=UPI002E260910|nr:integumentary mucin C.1-like [Corticium candelabrum]
MRIISLFSILLICAAMPKHKKKPKNGCESTSDCQENECCVMMGRYRFQCKRSPSEGETCSQDECSCPSGLECGMYKTKGKKDKKTVCKEPNANSTMTPPIHGPVKNMKKNRCQQDSDCDPDYCCTKKGPKIHTCNKAPGENESCRVDECSCAEGLECQLDRKAARQPPKPMKPKPQPHKSKKGKLTSPKTHTHGYCRPTTARDPNPTSVPTTVFRTTTETQSSTSTSTSPLASVEALNPTSAVKSMETPEVVTTTPSTMTTSSIPTSTSVTSPMSTTEQTQRPRVKSTDTTEWKSESGEMIPSETTESMVVIE